MKRKELIETVKAVFSSYLENNGHRKTDARFKVLEAYYSEPEHIDIDSLHRKLNRGDAPVSKATVYNTTELLVACGLIRKLQFKGKHAFFEKCYSGGQHDHLICVHCGKVMEFCDPRLQQIKKTAGMMTEFEIQHHSLILYGLCRECQKH